MRQVGANRKVLVGGLAILVAGVSIAYAVLATRQALEEGQATRSDADIARLRLAPDSPGYFSALNPNRQSGVHPPPPASCAPGAFDDLRQAAEELGDGGSSASAIRLLERALARDGSCVGAARLLAQQLARGASQIALRGWVAAADARPDDAPAQLLAAFYERAVGDGDAYRKYLERASAANPDQPLLHVAWSYYWVAFADPRSVRDQLRELESEVRVTGDLTSMAGLVREHVALEDDAAALRWCGRFYAEAPGSLSYGVASECARATIRLGDAGRERTAVDRLLAARSAFVGPPCRHAVLSWIYLTACRATDALAEADRATAEGCELPASSARRSALLQLGRFEEAAAPPPRGRYWGIDARTNHALALGIVGRAEEAREVAARATPSDDEGTGAMGMPASEQALRVAKLLSALLETGPSAEVLRRAVQCSAGTSDADRLARAGRGYTRALMMDEARQHLDRSMALDGANRAAWVARVYLLSVEGRLDEAALAGETALAAGVDDGGVLANLGYVYQQRGQCDRAVPLYERARAVLPLRESNYGNLAKCLDALGREEEARAVWRLLPDGQPQPSRRLWIWVGALVAGVVALYLGAKLALIRFLPSRFGHLHFP
jgi:tetratricopeptide (TPR) repeat protein